MDPRKPVFDALRAELVRRNRTLTQAIVASGDAWLDSIGFPRSAAERPAEPSWVATGRALIGEREIPGARHNSKIISWWRRGAAWFTDDETAWCGAFVKHCIEEAGLSYPKEFPRAAAWAEWGVACVAQVGAIGVKRRAGGNHVFIITGETADKRFFKALGGNQGDMVCEMDIAKADTFAVRWPAGVPQLMLALPVRPAGTVSRNEA